MTVSDAWRLGVMAGKGRKGRGTRCCVAACSRCQLSSPGVIFHSLPADTERRKLWTDAVHRSGCEKPLSPTARLLICSDHFLPECYERDLRLLADTGFSTKYAKLKTDAVPSIFPGRAPSEDSSCVKRRRTRVRTFVGYLVRTQCSRKRQHVASFQQSARDDCAHCRTARIAGKIGSAARFSSLASLALPLKPHRLACVFTCSIKTMRAIIRKHSEYPLVKQLWSFKMSYMEKLKRPSFAKTDCF